MSNQTFHTRAVAWLRDHMHLEPNLPTTTVAADPEQPTRARLDGTHVLGDPTQSSFGLLLSLFAVAGVAMMLAARGGVEPEFASGAKWTSIAAATLAGAVWILDARRARRSRVPVDVVVVARGGGDERALDGGAIERIASGAPRALWIVSELGFDQTGLVRLRELGARGFAVDEQRLVEVVPPG